MSMSVSIPVSIPTEITEPQGKRAGDRQMAPTMQIVCDAHEAVSVILKPKRTTGIGYCTANLDMVLRTHLKWMKIFLWIYVDQSNDLAHNSTKPSSQWIVASLRAVSTVQK